jgi:23S rRNA (uracil1939-C5)-methyltransferase
LKQRRRHTKPKKKFVERSLEFAIENMDSLGQGVAKIDNKPCFIPKTLPGETGVATLTKASKGVMFARLKSLDITADNREEPVCKHFENCPGCHYLQTDYQSELLYKQQALDSHLKRLTASIPDVEVVPAEQRLGYRNRIQLHYRHKYIGMIDGVSNNVLEIPECQAIDEDLRAAFDQLYNDRSWIDEHEGNGHCELYLNEESVSIEWDKPYSHGGFSQVNEPMNKVLKEVVLNQLKGDEVGTLLDLFSGEGNLSDPIVESNTAIERVMVDYAPDRVKQESLSFIHLDLFSETSLRAFKARCEHQKFDVILVDPPRKGFNDLALWVKALKPKKLIYVSCNAATMVRDLQQLTGKYSIDQVSLIDLFPSTYHYETLVTVTFA